jgi:hypothetical protein
LGKIANIIVLFNLYDCFFVDVIIHHFLWGLYTIILPSFLP